MTNAWVASYVALWCIAAVLAFIVMGLARQLGLIQLRLGIDPGVLITNEGLERGVRAPDFEATDILSGRSLRLSDFKGLRTVLVFLSPSCEACRKLVPHLNSLAKEEKGRSAVLAVCPAADAACLHFADDLGFRVPLLIDSSNVIGAHYGVRSTPFAFLINDEGVILIRGVVNSWLHIEALLKEEGTYQGDMPWSPTSQDGFTDIASDGNLSSDSVTLSASDVRPLARMISVQTEEGYGKDHRSH